MAKLPGKIVVLKHATVLFTFLLLTWGFYRFLFKLPEEIEELLIKPVVWLIPVIYLLKRERAGLSTLGITGKNLFTSIYLAILLGVIFAIEGLLVNILKYKGLEFSSLLGTNAFLAALLLSFATAISEEIAFRGYLFNRLWYALGSEIKANLITSFLWALIQLPISIFWWELDLPGVLAYLALAATFGMGSAFVFARTKNIFASILLHVFWGWPIALFR